LAAVTVVILISICKMVFQLFVRYTVKQDKWRLLCTLMPQGVFEVPFEASLRFCIKPFNFHKWTLFEGHSLYTQVVCISEQLDQLLTIGCFSRVFLA
jgi:hypothetical protein